MFVILILNVKSWMLISIILSIDLILPLHNICMKPCMLSAFWVSVKHSTGGSGRIHAWNSQIKGKIKSIVYHPMQEFYRSINIAEPAAI